MLTLQSLDPDFGCDADVHPRTMAADRNHCEHKALGGNGTEHARILMDPEGFPALLKQATRIEHESIERVALLAEAFSPALNEDHYRLILAAH